MKILYITNVDRRYAMMGAACRQLKSAGKLHTDCDVLKIASDSRWTRDWEERLSSASLVLIRWMGNTIRTRFWDRCRFFMEKENIPYFMDAAGSAEGEAGRGLEHPAIQVLQQYAQYGGMENYKNFWLYAQSLLSGENEKVKAPEKLCWAGIYHPDMDGKCMTDPAAYRERFFKPGRPALGMLFYRDEWIWDDLSYQASFVREAERQGYNVVPVFTNGIPDTSLGAPSISEIFHRYFMDGNRPVVRAIVNVMKFSFSASGSISTKEMEEIGIPVLEAYSLIMPKEEWQASSEGLTMAELSFSAAMPEVDGIIHTVPLASKTVNEEGLVRYLPMEERMRLVVSKAGKWARLSMKENKDKKVAIIFHNYPPKNSNIGSAVGLDTMESIQKLLFRMKEKGYDVPWIPKDGAELIRKMTSHATNDMDMLTDEQVKECEKLPVSEYLKGHHHFTEKVKAQLEKDWGRAPGSVMVEDGNILVPGTMDGHIFLTVQPARGYGLDPGKLYHDPYVAPTHQYLAFYQWLRDSWKADMVIHVGTHGNLEWLPGKGVGLDRESYPELALGDLPNLYFYHMTIVGEGIQAKRRGSACLVSHLPAPMAESGTYEELADLERLLDEYAHFRKAGEGQEKSTEKDIRKLALKLDLDTDVPLSEDFSDYVSRLHEFIEEIRDSETHVGLHVLGEMPTGEILTDTLGRLLQFPQGDVPSLPDLWGELYGISSEEMKKKAGNIYPCGLTGGELLARSQKEEKEMISLLVEKDFSEAAISGIFHHEPVLSAPKEWQEKLKILLSFACGELKEKLSRTKEEMIHAENGLDGHYIRPGATGSPAVSGPSILPPAINFYGLDPRLLPTKAAWKLGQDLANQVITQYIADEGKYPENIGMVLWSGANMRSHGQCIAEFLYFLGLKPLWQRGSGYVKDLEVIPLSELKRPRIDVTGRISGLFRDTMPQAAELLDRAILLASSLDERDEDNFVKRHVSEDSEALMREGISREEAWRQAAYRIFGDAPGTYGAGIGNLLESKNWQTLDDLSNVYIRWGGHAYGGKARGEFRPDLFRKRLSHMDVTIKNEDNHETNMLSSDDYNAYHGGMIASVRAISGKAPKSYAGDTTDRRNPKVLTVQETARRTFRSEAINPKYIKGMMKHGYKGAADLSNMVSISYQWDATTKIMDDWMYEQYAEKYVLDKDMADWMNDVNPWARKRIIETLLEADKRGLWKADEEMEKKLEELYLDVEGEMEAQSE